MENMSQDISKLAEALSKMQGMTPPVAKGKTAGGGKFTYSYADLSAIWEAIRAPLDKNGLSVTQVYSQEQDALKLITILMHNSGQWIRSVLNVNTKDIDIQKIGSAMTYNRRYALSAILGISTEDDDDGESVKDAPRQETAQVQYISSITASHIEDHIRKNITPYDQEWRGRALRHYGVDRFDLVPLSEQEKIQQRMVQRSNELVKK
jgi:hypothetical protein